jgi:large subunit ribosomal protein L5
VSETVVPRLQKRYREEVVPALKESFGVGNLLALPRLEKIVVNVGLGKPENQAAVLEAALADLAQITGQKPAVTSAKRPIAGFKLRKGDKIGLKVTLRGQRMYEFMDRLVHVAIPRVRDFRGLSPKAFDRAGNYSMGLAEHTVYPEIDIDKVQHAFGMDITFVITNSTPERSAEFLRRMGMPLRRNEPAAAAK